MPQENHNRVRSLRGRGVLTEARRRRGPGSGREVNRSLHSFFFPPRETVPLIYPPTLVDTASWVQKLMAAKSFSDKCFVCKNRIYLSHHQGEEHIYVGSGHLFTLPPSPPSFTEGGSGPTPGRGGGPGPHRRRFSRWPQPSRSGSNRTAPPRHAPRGAYATRQCYCEVERPRDGGRL